MKTSGLQYMPVLLVLLLSLWGVGHHAQAQPQTPAQCSLPELRQVLEECEEEVSLLQESVRPPVETLGIAFTSNTGYIDSALVRDQFRIRYDATWGIDYPDRAEFIYGKCDCGGGVSPGPAMDLDIQGAELALEHAFSPRFSLFAELPYRNVDLVVPALPTEPPTPVRSLHSDGIGDVRVGARLALLPRSDQYLTFQLRGYLPTGDESRNLGTGHSAIETGLLYYRQLTTQWSMEAEGHWWHPTGDHTDFAGDVLRFGVGVAHQGFGSTIRVSPVAELVGWYVVDGNKTDADLLATLDAGGDTIINLKLGVRMRMGDHPGSVYAGFGVALTDEAWYEEVFRLEYRHGF